MSSEKLVWDNADFATRYTAVEKITGAYAKHLLVQAGTELVNNKDPLVVLDLACGTAILTEELQHMFQNRPQNTFTVTCGDLADAMLDSAKERIKGAGWSNTNIFKVDAQDTKLPSNNYTHVFINFGPMLFPRPQDALAECCRMLRPGGICAFTTWQQVGWLDDIKSAFNSIPGVPPVSMSMTNLTKGFNSGEWHKPEFVRDFVNNQNFTDIKVTEVANTSIMNTREELRVVVKACIEVVKHSWSAEQRQQFDKPSLYENVEAWLWKKYGGKPVEWHWVALVTTSVKVS